MIIMFPTNEDIGLQATLFKNFDDAKFYTLIKINTKGAVVSIQSISNSQANEITPYAIVASNKINSKKYNKTTIFIDETSQNVDTALVKVLQENIFKKAS